MKKHFKVYFAITLFIFTTINCEPTNHIKECYYCLKELFEKWKSKKLKKIFKKIVIKNISNNYTQ